jgi:WD40 repeat protein
LDGHRDGIYSLAFSPDGKALASAGHKGVVIWTRPE